LFFKTMRFYDSVISFLKKIQPVLMCLDNPKIPYLAF